MAKNAGGELYFRLPIKAGPHEIAVTFAQTVHPELEGPRKPFEIPNRLVFGVVPNGWVTAWTAFISMAFFWLGYWFFRRQQDAIADVI